MSDVEESNTRDLWLKKLTIVLCERFSGIKMALIRLEALDMAGLSSAGMHVGGAYVLCLVRRTLSHDDVP